MQCRSILRTYRTEHYTKDPPNAGCQVPKLKNVPQTLFHLLKSPKKIIPRIVFPALFALDSPRPPCAVFVPQTANCLLRRSCHPARTVMGNPTHNRSRPAIDKTERTLPLNRFFPVHSHDAFDSSATGLEENGWYHTFSRKNVLGTMQPVANGGVAAK